ncbi:MAG: glycosyltransferase family 2 protein [Gammaproteobacteria bacterium]
MINPQIAIILCTYNGERFLNEQLESFSRQTFTDWALFVYDDGSTDRTSELIAQFEQAQPHHVIHWKPNAQKRGFAQNFLNGIGSTPGEFDFYALSDQDDVWCESKLSRAVDYLRTAPEGIPAVYCSRTTLVDADMKPIGLSSLFRRPPSFQNALVQSIAGGNTMVLNKAARALLLSADTHADIVSHDWLIYQLVTGAGGKVYYDLQPELLYRQHGANIIGSNLGFFARLYRMTNLFNGSFKTWMDKNLVVLQRNKQLLSTEHQLLLAVFLKCREESWSCRPFTFCKLGLYRQKSIDNLALYIAWVIGRL